MFDFKLPDLGEGVAEGEILAWHVAPGDAVAEDDVSRRWRPTRPPSTSLPVDGVVETLRYDEGDVVEVGEVIITIDEDGDTEAADAEAADEAATDAETATAEETDTAETEVTGDAVQSAKGGRVFAPPNVRRLARELGVDITTIPGSGPSGRVSRATFALPRRRTSRTNQPTRRSKPKARARTAGNSSNRPSGGSARTKATRVTRTIASSSRPSGASVATSPTTRTPKLPAATRPRTRPSSPP